MTTFSIENNTPWNGVERRLNGGYPDRVAILCDSVRVPRAPSTELTRRPTSDQREEPSAPARPTAY